MTIMVNGRKVEYKEEETISRLLKRMKYSFPLVVIKLNGTIISRPDFIKTKIKDHDIVEVIHLTSGG